METESKEIVLDTEEKLTIFLSENKELQGLFPPVEKVKKLTGGVANHVYRIIFKEHNNPKESRTSLQSLKTAVFKWYPTLVGGDKTNTVQISRSRFQIEKLALKTIGNLPWLKDCSIRVPKLYHHSDELFYIVIEDAGSNLKTVFELLRNENKGNKFCDKEQLAKYAQGSKDFLTGLAKEKNIDPIVENQFKNHPMKDMAEDYFRFNFKEAAEKFGLQDELKKYENLKIIDTHDPTDNVLIHGDFWPSSSMFDLDTNTIWQLDWEMTRFSHFYSDLWQFMGNLFVMKCNPEEFDAKNIEILIKQFQLAYFGNENDDYRVKGGDASIERFVYWVAILVKYDHWKIKDGKAVVIQALNEVKELQTKKNLK